MPSLLTEVVEVQSPTESGTTAAFSITYATSEATAPARLVPLRGKEMLSILGGIPDREHAELYVHGDVTIDSGYRVVHNSITWEVVTAEDYGDYIRCLVRRKGST